MRYNNAEGFDGLIMWAAGLTGPKSHPGTYYVKLNVGESSMIESFKILKDKRSSSSNEDLKEQFEFLIGIRDKVSEIHTTIKQIRSTRDQLNNLKGKLDENHEEINSSIKDLINRISKIEENLYQTKNRSGQDPLNFPIRLNNKLAHLSSVAGRGNFKPTDQMYGVRDELVKLIDVELNKWTEIKDSELDKINTMILENNIQLISIN
jgi:chromosome segregation ATPase